MAAWSAGETQALVVTQEQLLHFLLEALFKRVVLETPFHHLELVQRETQINNKRKSLS